MPELRTTFTNGEFDLEGVLHTPEAEAPWPGIAICHPHPQYGGDMNNNVVMAIVRGVLAGGMAALRFNFRGVGRSGGSYSGGDGEQNDALAALERLGASEGIEPERIGLAGYSFGASVAGAVGPQKPELRAIALVAPPAAGLQGHGILAFGRPKLLLAGDMDSVVSLDQLGEAVAKMAETGRMEVLEGGDHFLGGYEGAIARIAGQFFRDHLFG